MFRHVVLMLVLLSAAAKATLSHPVTAVAPEMPAAVPAPAPWPGLDQIAWTVCSPYPHSEGTYRAAACTDGRYYYICGGWIGTSGSAGPRNTLHRFDPESGLWDSLANMPGPNSNHCMVWLPSRNKLYVVGGYNMSGALNVNWEYDIATNTWATRAVFPVTAWSTSGAALGDSVFVLGGQNQFYRYFPGSNEWQSRQSVVPGSEGGAMCGGDGCLWHAAECMWRYDPATGWSRRAPRPDTVHGMGIARFEDRIYTYGGAKYWSHTWDDVFVYDIPGDSWYRETSMPYALGANNIVGGPCMGGMYYTSGVYASPANVHIRGEPDVVAVTEPKPVPLATADPGRARIYDITGREVRPGRPGVYFVRGGAGTRKVIVR